MPNTKVLKFSAAWCLPCRSIAPIFEQLKKEFPSVEFRDIDIDTEEAQSLIAKYGVRNIPLVVLENDDKTVRLAGVKSRQEYETALQEFV